MAHLSLVYKNHILTFIDVYLASIANSSREPELRPGLGCTNLN